VSIAGIRERQAEIIRILMGRKTETVPRLARELGVSKNTIYRDISLLSIDYPISTKQGNTGGVSLEDYNHPHKNLFSQEQQRVLTELLSVADKYQVKVLKGLLAAYGT
jgi:predicted DNA-binding transcriptional regulator YafY